MILKIRNVPKNCNKTTNNDFQGASTIHRFLIRFFFDLGRGWDAKMDPQIDFWRDLASILDDLCPPKWIPKSMLFFDHFFDVFCDWSRPSRGEAKNQ